MKQIISFKGLFFGMVISQMLCSISLAQQSAPPESTPPKKQERAEVTDFIGARDSKFKRPFQVRYLVFEDVKTPEAFKGMSAQWLFPPEGMCNGELSFPAKSSKSPGSEPSINPTWQMLCRSNWSATGNLSQTNTPGEYLGDGMSNTGSKVSFKLRKLNN